MRRAIRTTLLLSFLFLVVSFAGRVFVRFLSGYSVPHRSFTNSSLLNTKLCPILRASRPRPDLIS